MTDVPVVIPDINITNDHIQWLGLIMQSHLSPHPTCMIILKVLNKVHQGRTTSVDMFIVDWKSKFTFRSFKEIPYHYKAGLFFLLSHKLAYLVYLLIKGSVSGRTAVSPQ